ncbi:MAG: folate-binding protein [Mariprofundaceae bacterium]|nr:folate-binding protein [Mariprofundaceae bacterium]
MITPALSIPALSKQTAERLTHAYVCCRDAAWTVVKASGQGLRDYLQGQITQDIGRLSADQGIHACILTPQGKALCELYIIEGLQNELLMLTPTFIAEETVARLRRFALGYDLRIGIVESLAVWSLQGAACAQMFKHLDMPPPGDAWLAGSRHAQKEYLAMTVVENTKAYWLIADANLSIPASESSIAPVELEALRIIRGLPRFGSEWDASIHPLNVNLIDFDGVSFEKGCYVGQEVTSRMHWRGAIKKKLYRVQLENVAKDFKAELPCPIHSSTPIGELRALACDQDESFFGIALLPIDTVLAESPLKLADGTDIRILEHCHA